MTPCINEYFFAFSRFNYRENFAGYLLAALLFAINFYVFKRRKHFAKIMAFGFALMAILSVELGFRAYINFSLPEERDAFAWYGSRLRPENRGYQAHPFFQFTGKANAPKIDSKIFPSRMPFNNYGYPGADFTLKKFPGTFRIVCLGGSTTALGYTQYLESYLRTYILPTERIEIINLGVVSSTSAHMLNRFAFFARELDADMYVVHQAWNEHIVRQGDLEKQRPDYSNFFKRFSPKTPIDKPLIEWSALYRYLRYKVNPIPEFDQMEPAIYKDFKRTWDGRFLNGRGLTYYKRNIRTLLDLVLMDGKRVILTTQPFHMRSVDPSIAHIVQANKELRRIGAEYERKHKGKVFFLDVEKEVQEKVQKHFIDLGHLKEQGARWVARSVGAKIIAQQDLKLKSP